MFEGVIERSDDEEHYLCVSYIHSFHNIKKL